jgi:hypothetical protein
MNMQKMRGTSLNIVTWFSRSIPKIVCPYFHFQKIYNLNKMEKIYVDDEKAAYLKIFSTDYV